MYATPDWIIQLIDLKTITCKNSISQVQQWITQDGVTYCLWNCWCIRVNVGLTMLPPEFWCLQWVNPAMLVGHMYITTSHSLPKQLLLVPQYMMREMNFDLWLEANSLKCFAVEIVQCLLTVWDKGRLWGMQNADIKRVSNSKDLYTWHTLCQDLFSDQSMFTSSVIFLTSWM